MKKLILFLLLLIPLLMVAQVVIPTEPVADQFINWYNLLYGSLVILWGAIAKFFHLKSETVPLVFVVIAGGIVIAGGFIWFGWAQFLPVAITLLSSLGLYDILKGVKKAATAEPKK